MCASRCVCCPLDPLSHGSACLGVVKVAAGWSQSRSSLLYFIRLKCSNSLTFIRLKFYPAVILSELLTLYPVEVTLGHPKTYKDEASRGEMWLWSKIDVFSLKPWQFPWELQFGSETFFGVSRNILQNVKNNLFLKTHFFILNKKIALMSPTNAEIEFECIYAFRCILKHLEAFLEVASMQKVSAETLEWTEKQFCDVENCQEHIYLEVPKT